MSEENLNQPESVEPAIASQAESLPEGFQADKAGEQAPPPEISNPNGQAAPTVSPPALTPQPEASQPTQALPQPASAPSMGLGQANVGFVRQLLAMAKEKIQFRKRRKLEKIIALISQRGKIVNNDVQKLLRVSDATATRYLSQLVKEGRLKRVGKDGGSVYIP